MNKKLNKAPPKQPENYRVFYESVGKLYPEEELVFSSLRGLLRRQFVLSYLKGIKGCLVDLGCNRGYYISHYINGKAIGIDVAFSVLQAARIRNHSDYFIQGDAQDLSFIRSNTVNSILCSEMIEHVPDSHAVISECFRILKSDGILLITTPNYNKKKPRWVNVGEMKKYGIKGSDKNKYYHTAYRPEELKVMAEQAGFRVIENGTFEKEVKYSTRFPVLFYHSIYALNRFFIKSEKLYDLNDKMLKHSSLLIYKITKTLGLKRFLCSLVSEGVRTFLIAKKP